MSLTPPNFDQAEYTRVPPPMGSSPIEPAGASWFARSIAFGVAGMIVAAIAYAFLLTLPFRLSLFMIAIAYLVAKAMMIGSGDRGGRNYQIAAIVLTCISVGLGCTLWIWWTMHAKAGYPLSFEYLIWALPAGFEQPFTAFGRDGVNGALGLLILFIGLRAAWRMTSGLPGASQHPFRR